LQDCGLGIQSQIQMFFPVLSVLIYSDETAWKKNRPFWEKLFFRKKNFAPKLKKAGFFGFM